MSLTVVSSVARVKKSAAAMPTWPESSLQTR